MDKSKTWCIMPHTGMALQNHSDYCCCNVSKLSWKNNRREVMYVHSHPAANVYQTHTRKIIAAALDNGIQHPNCQTCWDRESAGDHSKRQRLNEIFGDVEIMPAQPRILIIKPGNTCNLACRMCNPMTSSSWYANGYELEKNNLVSDSWYDGKAPNNVQTMTFNEYTRSFENIRNSFNQDNTDFWDTLKGWIENLVYIDIYGGEPFLTPAMFDLLEHGVKIGANKNITLNLHTNITIFNQHYLDILTQYKKVFFQISLDSDNPAQLEYIRHLSKFETVIENSKKIKKIANEHKNIDAGVTYTVTPLNVYYADQHIAGLTKILDLPVAINIATTPEYDIRHLPPPVKQSLIDKLDNTVLVNFLKQNIPGCDVEWPRFCRVTDKLDQLRNQSFAKTFPEWWNMLEPYWIK